MPSSRLWVGLDVGADELVACVTDDGGIVQSEHRLPTSAAALDALLKPTKRRIKLIGLESGPFGIALTRSLRKLGYRVAMFEARQASKFLGIRRNKTDSNDARGLADVARLGQDSVSEVRVKSPESQRLRSILVTRRQIVQLRVQTEAAMRSLFRLNGGRVVGSASAAVFHKNVTNELKRLRKIERVDLAEDVEPLLALSMAMRSYLKALDERLARRAEQDPVCRRFLAIPGIGPISALSFISSIEDPARFRRNADVGAFLGLVPVVRQSGQSVTRLRISKAGDAMTRGHLSTAAVIHLRFGKSSLATWGAGLSERLGKRGVQTALARRLAVTMLAMWKTGKPYDPDFKRRGSEESIVSDSARGAAGRAIMLRGIFPHQRAQRYPGLPTTSA
jgi:transposase